MSDRTTLRWTGAWARARGVRSMMVSHDSLAGLMTMFSPPGVPAAWLADQFNRSTARSYDVVVCTTAWAAAEFRRLGVPNLLQVPLGVDLACFHPRRRDEGLRSRLAPDGQALLVHCSRLSPEKRPQRALGALAELRRRGLPAVLVVAGDGPQRRSLQARAPGLPVRFLRHISDRGVQLPLALSVRPALASVLVGVNDTLRGRFDPAAIAADLENTVAALQRAGTVVLTASLPDPGLLLRIPASIRRPLARRAHQINAVLGQLAVRYDLVHVDLAARPEIYDKRMWGVDRLHPSERGHRMLARMFAERLAERGMPPLAPPDPEPANPEPSAWRQAHWMATKGTGWMVRRSRDLLPGLLQLALAEWWHDLRGHPADPEPDRGRD